MIRKLLPLFIVMAMVVPGVAFAANSANDLIGFWYSDGKESIIQIENINGKYDGKIVWLDEPLYEKGDEEEGKPKRNREDRDKSRRNLPIIGLNMLNDFVFDAEDQEWTGGTIYDPNVGKTYKCVIKFEEKKGDPDAQVLYVRGYIGVPALGRTTYWTPVPEADLKKLELVKDDEAEKE